MNPPKTLSKNKMKKSNYKKEDEWVYAVAGGLIGFLIAIYF